MPELFKQDIIPAKTWQEIIYQPYQQGGQDVGIMATEGQTLFYPVIIGGLFEGSSFKTNNSGARLEIFPDWDKNIGVVVFDNQATPSEVFKILIDGTDVGDIIGGDYASNKGFKWDSSAGTFSVKGALVAYTGSSVDASYISGTFSSGNLNVADRGWTQTCVFSVTDADTIAWAAGSFIASDGTTYSIGAGNSGNMSARSYIYLDTAVSTTAYQITTTASTAVGAGKVLIATAINGTGEATFQTFGGLGGQNINASDIVANSITANELSTSILYAGTITLDTAGNIKGGQTAYATGTGFWLGYDTSAYKFSVGSSSQYMTFDGTNLFASNIGIVNTLTAYTNVVTDKALCVLSDGKIIQCTSLFTGTSRFVGFAAETITAGNTVKNYVTGRIGGFSGLTIGSDYYLQDNVDASYTTITQTTNNSSQLPDGLKKPTQTIIPTRSILYNWIMYLKNNSASTYNFRVKVWEGDNVFSVLTGTSDTVSVPNGGPTEYTFSFSTPLFMVVGNTYTILFEKSDGTNPPSDVAWYYQNSDVYADGYYRYAGVDQGDLYFKVNQKSGGGSIGTSVGSVTKKVGMAISATELLIQNS